MMKLDEVQSVLLRNLVGNHPALADELDSMVQGLPDNSIDDLYRGMFRHRVNDIQWNKGTGQTNVTDGAQSDDCGEESELRTLSGEEILQTEWPEPIWAVPGLLPVGLVILAGAPKIGKSWLSLQLAKAITMGEAFFNVPVQRGKVLVCALEDSPQRLKKRMQAMGWDASSQGLEASRGVDFLTLAQMNGSRGGILKNSGEILASKIKRKNYQLVVIDTLSRAIPADQQDVQIMTRELTPLQEMSHELNCAVMLCDHHRKSGGVEGDAVADILGSTAKGAMADTVWSLYRERGKRGAKLSITGRDVEEQTLQLVFNSETHYWEYQGNTTSLAVTDRRQEVLDVIARKGKASLRDVVQGVDKPKSHTHGRLQDLVDAGLVRRITEGKHVFYQQSELPATDNDPGL